MNAIIIAAGMGKRMKQITASLPKCIAVKLNGKSLLQHQIDTLNAFGIRDISVIRRFEAEKINIPHLRYFTNPEYTQNNIMESLFYAEDALKGDVLVAYADLWYELKLLETLNESKHDIAIAVQADLKKHYAERMNNHPIEQLELVRWNDQKNVVKIGKFAHEDKHWSGEFIGVMKLTAKGCELLKKHHAEAKKRYDGKPFQRASLFKKSYLTDLLQEMADQGVAIHCREIKGSWFEIDTAEDYEEAAAFFKKARL